MADAIQYCVVCGRGSHRTDWINTSGSYVACDYHTKEQMVKAIADKSVKESPAPAPTTKAPVPIPAATTSTQPAPAKPNAGTVVVPGK